LENTLNSQERPLISFILFAYNQEKYVEEAIKGAFSQTYSPLEIIFSDDFSSDRTFEIMEQMVKNYSGPHKIILNRNKENLGLGLHINKGFELCSSDIVVVGAGDDVSLPNRVALTVKLFLRDNTIKSVSFDPDLIDENSNYINETTNNKHVEKVFNIDTLKQGIESPINGFSRAYRKDVISLFTPLKIDCPAEDAILSFRALMLGGTIHSSEKMVKYRVLSTTLSSKINETKTNYVLHRKLEDLKVSKDFNFINTKDYEVLKYRVIETSIVRINHRKILNSKVPLVVFFKFVFLNKKVSFINKKKLFLLTLKRHLTKKLKSFFNR
jgi:glycosyltransferase involved in cell wall biosynthesis